QPDDELGQERPDAAHQVWHEAVKGEIRVVFPLRVAPQAVEHLEQITEQDNLADSGDDGADPAHQQVDEPAGPGHYELQGIHGAHGALDRLGISTLDVPRLSSGYSRDA